MQNVVRQRKRFKKVRRKYRQLFKNAPAGIYDIDFVQNKITSVNDVACHVSGYSRDEILNMSPLDLLSDDSKTLFLSRLESIELGNRISDIVEFEIIKKSGEKIWVLLSINFKYENNQIVGASVVAHDITENKQMKLALQESEERFKLLYEKAPLPYQSLDKNGNFLQVNQAWLDVFGYTEEEVIGKHFSDFLPEKSKEKFTQNFLKSKAVEEIQGVEIAMVKKNGSKILITLNGKNIRNKSGDFEQAHCILADITAHRREEEKLRRNEDLLNSTQKLSKIGGWEWNINNQTIFWTDEVYRIHDFAPGTVKYGDMEDSIARSIECYRPEDRPIILNAFNKCAEEGVPYDLEFPFTTAKGRKIWIRTSAQRVLEKWCF